MADDQAFERRRQRPSQRSSRGAGDRGRDRPSAADRDQRGSRATGRGGDQRRTTQSQNPSAARPERPPAPPGLERKQGEPRLPADVDLTRLHRSVRAELRGLPKDLADVVAGHLVLAGELIDTDPELAYGHAEAARRRAARLPIVREAAAETAYAAGRFDVALSEFRALRRMTGVPDYLPVMADCERALGRPQAAIKLAKEARRTNLDPALAGGDDHRRGRRARRSRAVGRVAADPRAGGPVQPSPASPVPRLRWRGWSTRTPTRCCGAGTSSAARRRFASAAELDVEGETDAVARRDELDGMIIAFDEAAFDEAETSTRPTPARNA